MQIHPRAQVVTEAGLKLTDFRLDALAHLTPIEQLQILHQEQQTILRYMLRAERHPKNPSKRADEA